VSISFPLIYYSHAGTEGMLLANSLMQLGHLAERASDVKSEEPVRLAAAVLKMALVDIAGVLARKFVSGADAQEPHAVFAAVARDHLQSVQPETR
jgi:hypothetical protein